MQKSKTALYKTLSDFQGLKWRIAFKGIFVGFLAGLLAVLYRVIIEYGTGFAVKIYSFLRLHPVFILLFVLTAAAAGVFIAWLIKREPMASGSGIPQTEGVVLYGLKMKWYTILAVRYIGGAIGAFFGLSLGREGPSIQIGASAGQALSSKFAKGKIEENCLITGGAAAGLSAAFNAPLSGIVFALEEVHRSFSPLILIAATTASLTADFVSKYFLGLRPVLAFAAVPQLPVRLYFWLLPVALLSGLMGSLMNKLLLVFQTIYNRLPQYIRPCISLLIALPCGLLIPSVLGGGQNLIKLSENARGGIALLLVIMIVKMLFTSTSFGSGTPGGIFMPILSVGALSGCICGLCAGYFGLPGQFIPAFVVCAMAGALSAAVKAPVTSILLAAEMTGSLVHLLPVAACSFIALLFSDLLNVEPIYEALLERFIKKGGRKSADFEKGGFIEQAVELGSMASGRMIKEIDWPNGALVVGLKRGGRELVPGGKTKVLTGDYLVVISSDGEHEHIREQLRNLCRPESMFSEKGGKDEP